ncbi:HamA C-terminal domain-containing protein [Agrobacterium cavarae]|uniref:HamA C-terminal domain-containing protein n=1 Tax=Agrobacterium cavarae TaxID=2528239 RepID=UPI003EE4CB16
MKTSALAPLSLSDFRQAIELKPNTLEVHLDLVERNVEISGCNVRIHCHCLKVDADGRVSVARLAEFIRTAVIDYAIPHEARQRAKERDSREGGFAATIELYHRAVGMFTDLKTSGEGGELLLYLLAERFLGLPQILCKMSLKTSSQVHYHGADGVYANVDEDGVLNLYWGESKIHSDVTRAIRECLSSLKPFLDEEEGEEAMRERDLVLLSERADLGKPELNASLRRFFDHTDPLVKRKRYRAVALVGFDSEHYPAAGAKSGANDIVDASREALKKWSKNVGNRLAIEKLTDCQIEFLCLPLPNADAFRAAILASLGLAK